jgi:hypothetical protein
VAAPFENETISICIHEWYSLSSVPFFVNRRFPLNDVQFIEKIQLFARDEARRAFSLGN